MIPTAIITFAMFAVWLYLSYRLNLPEGMGFSFDVGNMTWSFLQFFDRYVVLLRFVGWLTAIMALGAVLRKDADPAFLLGASLIANIALQSLMLFWYERFCHAKASTGVAQRFVYGPRKYAFILTLSVAVPTYLVVGVVMLAERFVR